MEQQKQVQCIKNNTPPYNSGSNFLLAYTKKMIQVHSRHVAYAQSTKNMNRNGHYYLCYREREDDRPGADRDSKKSNHAVCRYKRQCQCERGVGDKGTYKSTQAPRF